jgi:uncharacterized protein YcbX
VQVTRLTTYPVKSLGGTSVARAAVTAQGLLEDRRWALVDTEGHPVTARECHALLSITAEAAEDGSALLTAPDGESVRLPPTGPTAEQVEVGFSRVDRLSLGDAAASSWLSHRAGREVRLVRLADPTAREIGASHGGLPGETMSLADAGPILLVSETSVQRLRDWVLEESEEEWVDLDEAIGRFRANVVVDGAEPFAEDAWERVSIGGTTYRHGELCDRCVMTTIALDTYETTPEPIRTLARHRRWDGTTWFGVRLVPELGAARGHIAVGDDVTVP